MNYNKYQKVNHIGAIIFLILGLVITTILGFIYSLTIEYISIGKYYIIIGIIYALIIYFILEKLTLALKVRSLKVTMVLVSMIAIFAVYIRWVSSIFIIFNKLMFNPLELFKHMNIIVSTEFDSVRAFLIWFLWGVEVFVIVGGIIVGCFDKLSKVIFCENCNGILSGVENISGLSKIEDENEFKSLLEKGDLSPLYKLKPIESYIEFSMLIGRFCNDCYDDKVYLTVKNINVIKASEKRGKGQKIIVENLIIDKNEFFKIKRALES
ncbi:hypothetical protein SAMN02745163_00007 [Clostridium cavendishii DSM 21758]|uniref:Uncharacterized protein n=1 Tax=Clostridium cavendishii DSM 21758 TaxID=1121302 RepID=A0A1M6A7L4_9CLOT|nr:hypothetical protein [Clostridium cavendishii]SHI32468.1 hypothetical protein SAMN02745163_00007 [Clostridium cavendishii DSM 21758]